MFDRYSLNAMVEQSLVSSFFFLLPLPPSPSLALHVPGCAVHWLTVILSAHAHCHVLWHVCAHANCKASFHPVPNFLGDTLDIATVVGEGEILV